MVDGGVGVPIFQVGVTWLRTGDSLRSHRVVGWGVEVRSGSLERLCPQESQRQGESEGATCSALLTLCSPLASSVHGILLAWV